MSDTVTERLAQVLAGHSDYSVAGGAVSCECGQIVSDSPEWPIDNIDSWPKSVHMRHLAAVLAPVVDELVAEAKVEALCEAAEQIYNGAGDPEQEFYDRGVAHWLLGRAQAVLAARIARAGGTS